MLNTQAHLQSSPCTLTLFRSLDSQGHLCARSKSLCGWATCPGWTLPLAGACASELHFNVGVEEGSLTQLTQPRAAGPFTQGLFKAAAGECQRDVNGCALRQQLVRKCTNCLLTLYSTVPWAAGDHSWWDTAVNFHCLWGLTNRASTIPGIIGWHWRIKQVSDSSNSTDILMEHWDCTDQKLKNYCGI